MGLLKKMQVENGKQNFEINKATLANSVFASRFAHPNPAKAGLRKYADRYGKLQKEE